MSNLSAETARSITREGSKQSYLIARLLADRDLVDDCLRAYAYFRWADDVIDVFSQSAEERLAFIREQRRLVDRLYAGERPDGLVPEEQMIADLIAHDRAENSGLQSFIRSFLQVLEFDAGRKGEFISQAELTWYSHCLGMAVTDAIQYFIGNDHTYASVENRYMAATAAHITHVLRDMAEDLADGFINVPQEWLKNEGFDCICDVEPKIVNDPAFRAWVQSQVELARDNFREGKKYLNGLEVLRCKIAAYWYCARFECVLDAIESDDYILRPEYRERNRLATKLKMGWLAIFVTLQHYIQSDRRSPWKTVTQSRHEATVMEDQGRPFVARRSM